jgi:hypothetical protein
MSYCTCPACRDHWLNDYEDLWHLSDFIEELIKEEDFLPLFIDDKTEQEVL